MTDADAIAVSLRDPDRFAVLVERHLDEIFRYAFGSKTGEPPVKFGQRVFLYEVQPRNYAKGHRPQLVLGLDRNGHVIARQRLGPYAN